MFEVGFLGPFVSLSAEQLAALDQNFYQMSINIFDNNWQKEIFWLYFCLTF